MITIVVPAAIIGGLGLVFGLLLGFASKQFAVEVDEREQEIRALLPGANCGGCGVPSCDALAAAIANGQAEPTACVVNTDENAQKIGMLLGVSVDAIKRNVATIICQGSLDHCKLKFDYEGVETCAAANKVMMGRKSCRFSCLGYGDCVRSCKFNALEMTEGGIPRVTTQNCTGCHACENECPRDVIRLMPDDYYVHVLCRTEDKGKAVRDACTTGCITCRMCERACNFGAISCATGVAVIDYDKCVGCLECADKCPTNAIVGQVEKRRVFWIDQTNCKQHGKCKEACPFDAILGGPGEHYTIDPELCKGCGECAKVCPENCISTVKD